MGPRPNFTICSSHMKVFPKFSSWMPNQNENGCLQSAAPAKKSVPNFLKKAQKCHLSQRTTFEESHESFGTVTKCQTKRGCATVENCKNDCLPSICQKHRIQTCAKGCGRLQTVGRGCAKSGEHTVNTQTPTVTWEPLLRTWEKTSVSTSVQRCAVNVGGQTHPLIGPSTQLYQINKQWAPC